MRTILKSPWKTLCHKLNRRCERVATDSRTIVTAAAHCRKQSLLLCRTVLMSNRESLLVRSSMKVLNQKSAAISQVQTSCNCYHLSCCGAVSCTNSWILALHAVHLKCMSTLPENVAGPPESSGRLSSSDSIIDFLRCRLLNLHSTAASTMPLRPKLQEVYDKLDGMLSNTAETPGANHSFLLIGSRGTGKSLVCSLPLSLNGQHHSRPMHKAWRQLHAGNILRSAASQS